MSVNITKMMPDKETLTDQINYLKKKKIIKTDADVARALNYTRGALSEMKSHTSGKPVTYAFTQKFKEHFGKHLIGYVPEEEVDILTALEIRVKVLQEEIVGVLHQLTGKQLSTISSEIDTTVKISMQNRNK